LLADISYGGMVCFAGDALTMADLTKRVNTMTDNQLLSNIRDHINSVIRRNSDRGFIPYSGCNQICGELFSIMQEADAQTDQRQAFDMYSLILLKMIKLISHADTSSGAAGDVIQSCLAGIDKLCQFADEENYEYFFDTIIKTAKNKAFHDWPDDGYRLLKSAVYFVCDKKQAQKVVDVFPLLGDMYDGKPYPDKLLITLAIVERMDGTEAAEKYLMEHIDVPELRMVAVDRFIVAKKYSLAEKLCRDALESNIRGHFNRRAPWAYYLERMYTETDDQEKLTQTIRFILFNGDTAYFSKLKVLYQQQGVWEEQRESLWQELSKALSAHEYATLLAQEGEVAKLMDVIKRHKSYVIFHGKQLAESFPEETHKIFAEYILEEAKVATDRRKYKQVCRLIKEFSAVGAKEKAFELIDQLSSANQRRPAMLEELAGIRRKLEK
jgi:hypothetical protein